MSCAEPYIGRTGAQLLDSWTVYRYVNPPVKAATNPTRPVVQPRPPRAGLGGGRTARDDGPAAELLPRAGAVVGSLRGTGRGQLGKPRPMDPRRPAQAWDARHENTDAIAMERQGEGGEKFLKSERRFAMWTAVAI